jgi:hypothetical protein
MPKLDIQPKQLRDADQWTHYNVIKNSIKLDVAKETLDRMVLLTCRDCFGFGHSAKKCPTAKKFDLLRTNNALMRSLISRYRAKLSHNFMIPNRRS